MSRISPQRALCTSLVIALTALLTLLVASPAAFASVSGSTRYEYKVYWVSYKAEGAIVGWHVNKCVGTSLVEGVVTTDSELDLGATFLGKLSLTIHGHGSSGSGYAKIDVKSQLSNSFFRETTACDSSEKESAATETHCAQPLDSKMHVSVLINGGVGNHVKLSWDFFHYGGASGTLLPDSFSCVEPLTFPDGTCTTKASLSQFNKKFVTLPFVCLYDAEASPPGRNYTKYLAVANTKGELRLKRTH